MIPVLWLWLLEGEYPVFWDNEIIKDTIKRLPYSIEHWSMPELGHGAVVVLPAQQHMDLIRQVNERLACLDWVLLILTGDEELIFPVTQLQHPNMVVWAQYHNDVDRRIPLGYTPHCRPSLPVLPPEKDLNWFFAGQINNEDRRDLAKELRILRDDGLLIETEGFTQGIEPEEYMKNMVRAKVIPSPVGVHEETFRMYEAFESGSVPWIHSDWNLEEMLQDWKKLVCLASTQWQGKKRDLAIDMTDTIKSLSGIEPTQSDITVLIPTSSIPSHPSTDIIEETVKSVRDRLPASEILIMIDGLPADYQDRKDDYEEYTRRLLWLTNQWDNVTPILFEEHSHQVRMTMKALELVRTPTILFVEHDTPLIGEIDWDGCVGAIQQGDVDVMRLSHESNHLFDLYEHLMLGQENLLVHEAKFAHLPIMRTIQWSQRPHLAKTDYYRYALGKFTKPSDGMIEDRMHGIVQSGHDDPEEWGTHRIAIYAPEGDIKRSTHLNGRGDDEKVVEV